MQLVQVNIGEQQSVKCCLYSNKTSSKTVAIASAAGVLQSFWQKLAQFFQSNGISAITFDYSGVGKSLHRNIKNRNNSLVNRGNRDLNEGSKIRMWVNWFLLFPILTNGFGYLPSKKFSRMESLSKNVAEDNTLFEIYSQIEIGKYMGMLPVVYEIGICFWLLYFGLKTKRNGA